MQTPRKSNYPLNHRSIHLVIQVLIDLLDVHVGDAHLLLQTRNLPLDESVSIFQSVPVLLRIHAVVVV